jgi:hypothetical protein
MAERDRDPAIIISRHFGGLPRSSRDTSRAFIMIPVIDGRTPSGVPRGLLLRLCTRNPFYVLSAGLFLLGLEISFGEQLRAEDTWALMAGLAGYTLMLAVAACLLVRFGNVWDDVRTVLLLVVLLFLATSVTFDEVLVLEPQRGAGCFLVGLLFAITVSEAVLRGARLRLPAWYRGPYYLVLALFFLYPLALRTLLVQDEPRSEAMLWGLFGFTSAAGLVFLTLLPAVRRGSRYVRHNGSPWSWPLYPWALFGVLGFAVAARSFLLCWSMQLVGEFYHGRLIFGPYFLVPFGLAIAVLLLEGGLRSEDELPVRPTRRRSEELKTRPPRLRYRCLGCALALPLGLVVLALVGHKTDPVYQDFLDLFAARLGGTPAYLTALAVLGFYIYAAVRRAPFAVEALTGSLVVLAVIGPETLTAGDLVVPRPAPVLAAAMVQLAMALRHRAAWRCLLGGASLAAGAALAVPVDTGLREPLAAHVLLATILVVGAAFGGALAQALRILGAAATLVLGIGVIVGWLEAPAICPRWVAAAYPLVLAALIAAYGYRLRHVLALSVAVLLPVAWLTATSWRGYRSLRQVVAGLDYLAMGLALLALALFVSLAKSGLLMRWLLARRECEKG